MTVTSTTANGIATIDTSVSDKSGNSNSDSDTFSINKNQITGSVELESFVGASRQVTFVATGGVKETWTPTLSFTGTTASFTLTDVPDGSTDLSAKTAWNLRRKVSLVGGTDNQWTADLTGGNKLLGGDLNDSYGFFIDYGGNDRYHAEKATARGFATNRDPKRQPTRDRPYLDLSVFLDLGGTDEYTGPARGADGTTWIQNRTGRGIGMDLPTSR